MQGFEFNTVGRIVSGLGSSLELQGQCAQLGVKRPLLVTDPGLVAIGLVQPVVAALKNEGLSVLVFDQVKEDPPEATVLAAADMARCGDVDGIIAVGGGSSMDVAKVVAVLLGGEQPLVDLYGVGQVSGGRLPLILVPTTAGTGSEVTPVAVITTGETTKAGVSSPVLLPDVAVLDAALTLGLPAPVTAMTGVDAMVHAIEAYTSRHKKNPLSDNLAIQALNLLSRNIRTAVNDGGNHQARENMLLGACLAGQAFANAPVAAVHALAYPLGGHYHIPHGLSNSLVLPSVLEFNAPQAADLYAELAEVVLGEPLTGSAEARTAALIEGLRILIDDVSLPATLNDAKVKEQDLEMLAEDAMLQQRLLVNNPRDVAYEDALGIYRAAYGECCVSKAPLPTRADYKVFYPISTRWSDNDIYGHVNNVVYYSYFDSAANRYLIEEGGLDISDGSIVAYVVNSGCEYHAPVTYPEPVEAGVRVDRLGNSSVQYGIAIFKEGVQEATAHGHFVHVFVERAQNRSIAIPQNLREALQRLLV